MTTWLGVDAGSRNVGWCVLRIVGHDVFWLASDCMPPAEYATLTEIAHDHDVDCAVVERPGGLSGGEMRRRVHGEGELRKRCAILVSRGEALIQTAYIAGVIAGTLDACVSKVFPILAVTARAKMTGDQYADDATVAAKIKRHVKGWPARIARKQSNNAHTRDAALAVLAQNRMMR